MSDVPLETKPRRRWGRSIKFWLFGLFALLVLGHAFWGWYQNQKLTQDVEALRRKGEPMLLAELRNQPVADEDNAAILLRAAGRMIDQTADAFKEFNDHELAPPLTEQELAMVGKFVEDNRKALAKLREARGKKGVDWQVEVSLSADHSSMFNQQRALALLAAAAMLLEHQKGNDREVVELALDMLAQSDAMEQMPTGMMPHLIGLGIAAYATDRVAQSAAELRVGQMDQEARPQEVRKLIDKLLEESRTLEGQRRALRVERALQVQMARTLNSFNWMEEQKGPTVVGYVMRPIFLSDGRIVLRHTSQIMEIAQGAKNWPEFAARSRGPVDRIVQMKRKVVHPLVSIVVPTYDAMAERTFRLITERRMAAVGLAIRLYALDHGGKMPGSLEELVPKYLPGVPGDAMAEGKKMGYVAEEKRPRVYSVGTNGKDDGGSDQPLRKQSQATGRWLKEDVVVDLKRQERKLEGEVEPE